VIAAGFVRQSGLASFADDSVAYLVMAQVFSPWQAASPPVAEAFVREAFYPPLFPLLLALAGAAHDLAWAHVLTALLLAAGLPLVYAIGRRWLASRWTAAAAVAVTMLLPTFWIHARAILSESLFCLLLLGTLRVIASDPAPGRRRNVALGLLMAALALTRTVGLVVACAHGAWALTRKGPLAERARAALPALAAIAAYGAWIALRPAGTSDEYLQIVMERLRAIGAADAPVAAAAASIARQAGSIAEAWTGALVLFWVEGSLLRPLLTAVVGLLAMAGLALRFASGKADAWMVAAYLATFLAWPFYDQMGRFLFPVVPVLLLYAFWLLERALDALPRRRAMAHGLLVLLMVTLSVPALGFIAQRAKATEPHARIIDWYRTPDLDQARARARVHLDLMADMEEIHRLTRPGDRIMWVAPSYIALLADRHGVAAPGPGLMPEDYRRAVQRARPDYVFLSVYHPRDTIRDAAWQAGIAALSGRGEAVHVRSTGGKGRPSSILLKVDPARLGQWTASRTRVSG
jgi:hypothetical protein